MAQDVKLKLGIDVGEAEKAFSSLIKKIQNDADKLKLTPSTAAASKGNAIQSARDQERNLTKEKMVLDSINKTLEIRKKHLEDIYKIEAKTTAEIVNKQRAEERAVARLNHAKTVGVMQQTNYNAAQAKMRTSMGLSNGQQPPGMQGSIAGDVFKGTLGAMGTQQVIKAAIETAKALYVYGISERSMINVSGGSAVRNNVGYQNQSMLSGDLVTQTLLQNQMPEARQIAEKKWDRTPQNVLDRVLSRVLPAIGMTDARKYFETERENQIGADTLTQANAMIDQNNPRVLAAASFKNTFDRNLGAERSLGLGTSEFEKMQMQINNKGFLTDQGLGMLNQIQGSGGSSSGGQASNFANLGLGMQRGMNLTNSGNILGKLSGLLGNTESGFGKTSEISESILEKAITKGFNKSENTEILRKFTEVSANMIYNSEAKTPQDVDAVTSRLANLLSNNPTMKQFNAAQSADAAYQNASSQTSGRGGTLGFAAINGPGFSKLSPMQIGNLLKLEEGNVTSTNSDIIAASVQQGTSPEEMETRVKDAKRTSVLATYGESDKMLAPLKNYLGKRNYRSLFAKGGAELRELMKNNPAVYKSYEELQTRSGLLNVEGGDEGKMAAGEKLLGQQGGFSPNTGRARTAMTSGTAGKSEEEYLAAQAHQEKQLVLNLAKLRDELMPTVRGIEGLTTAIMKLGDAAKILGPGGISGIKPQTVETKSSMGRTPGNGSKPNGAGQ